MKFCPECNSIVLTKNGKLKCRCGWEEKVAKKKNLKQNINSKKK